MAWRVARAESDRPSYSFLPSIYKHASITYHSTYMPPTIFARLHIHRRIVPFPFCPPSKRGEGRRQEKGHYLLLYVLTRTFASGPFPHLPPAYTSSTYVHSYVCEFEITLPGAKKGLRLPAKAPPLPSFKLCAVRYTLLGLPLRLCAG